MRLDRALQWAFWIFATLVFAPIVVHANMIISLDANDSFDWAFILQGGAPYPAALTTVVATLPYAAFLAAEHNDRGDRNRAVAFILWCFGLASIAVLMTMLLSMLAWENGQAQLAGEAAELSALSYPGEFGKVLAVSLLFVWIGGLITVTSWAILGEREAEGAL